MTRKPRNLVLGVLILIAASAAGVHQSQVDAVNRRQQSLNDALVDAIPNHHIASVRDLLRRGADPNCEQQPTSFSERLQNVSPAVWHLLHPNESPNPNLYMTPLGMAVLNCQQDTVQVLLDAGANVEQKDSYGETALDVDANGEDSIYKMLKSTEAKQKKNHAVNGTAIERRR